MRLRQVVLAAGALDPVVQALCEVLGLEVAFRDPAVEVFGLRNAVLPVGDTFLEVVSPAREDAPAARFLARRGEDGGYMVILQTDDLERDRARIARLGVRVVWEASLPDIATVHLHPRDVGGAILSLDVARPPASWRWAGPEWNAHVRTERSHELLGVELASPDPAALAARWARILGRPDPVAEANGWTLPLERGGLRFVPSPVPAFEGLGSLEVATSGPARVLEAARRLHLETGADWVRIGGVRIRPV